MGDVIEEWMNDPDNRAKVFLTFNIGIILTNFLITLGAMIFVLKILGYI